MAPRTRKPVTEHVIAVGWMNNHGIWLECTEACGWTLDLGYAVTTDDIAAAAAAHRKQMGAS